MVRGLESPSGENGENMVEKKFKGVIVMGASLLAACAPTQVVEIVNESPFVATPDLVVIERAAADGAKVEARLRFNGAAKPRLDELIESLEIVERAELLGELEAIDESGDEVEPRFAIPDVEDSLPLLRVDLLDADGAPLEGYGYRVSLPVRVARDESAGKDGVAAPSGLGLVGCMASMMTSSSIPFVHLMELRAPDASSGARLNAEVESVALVTEDRPTHFGLVANGFYAAGFDVEVEMSCL
jgi:hypothetical protein